MSWLGIGGNIVQTGSEASKDFRTVMNLVSELISSDGRSVRDALQSLIGTTVVSAAEEKFAKAVLQWAGRVGDSEAAKLLQTLAKLEDKSELRQRQVGWPLKEWSFKPGANAIAPIMLQIDPSIGAYFEVAANETGTESSANAANAKLVLNGSLDIAATGDVPDIAPVSAMFGLSAGLRRSASLVLGYETDSLLAGVAIAGAIGRLRSPADFDDVSHAFSGAFAGRLEKIVVEGDEHIGAEAAVKASVPTSYGTFGFNLKGEAVIGRDFVYEIKPHGDSSLALDIRSGSKFSNSFDIGVSYSVGLSTIAPGVATALASKIAGLSETVQRIDAIAEAQLGRVSTWLKPGALLREKINTDFLSALDFEGGDNLKSVFAGLFGVRGDADDAAEKIAGYAADLISRLGDNLIDLTDLGDDVIREKFSKALRNHVNERALSILNEHVIGKIPINLTDELERLTDSLDENVKSKIAEFLGVDGETAIDEVASYLDEARKIVDAVLKGVSNAQTELLAAEVGWRRARVRETSAEYRLRFDGDEESAKEAFRDAILAPRRIGNLLKDDTDIAGVDVDELSAKTRLFKSSGPRWNLALIGFGIGGERIVRSKIAVEETQEGVIVLSGEGELSKRRKFLKEARSVSFLSASGLVHARGQIAEAAIPFDEAGSLIRNVTGPRSAASIQINFEEIDNKIKTREARRLLERFVGAEMLSEEISDKFQAAVDEARGASPDGKLAGSMSLSLAVPTEIVGDVLRHARDNVQVTTDATDRALAVHDGARVEEVIEVATALDASLTNGAPTARGEAGHASGLGMARFSRISARGIAPGNDVQRRIGFLRELDTLSRVIEAEKLSGAGPRGVARSDGVMASDLARTASVELAKLSEARATLRKVLAQGARLYFDTPVPEFNSTAERIEFAKMLEEEQRDMVKAAKPFLRTGVPLPNMFGGKAPESTVALFAALQVICREAVGMAPPLITTLKPEKRSPVSFISVATN